MTPREQACLRHCGDRLSMIEKRLDDISTELRGRPVRAGTKALLLHLTNECKEFVHCLWMLREFVWLRDQRQAKKNQQDRALMAPVLALEAPPSLRGNRGAEARIHAATRRARTRRADPTAIPSVNMALHIVPPNGYWRLQFMVPMTRAVTLHFESNGLADLLMVDESEWTRFQTHGMTAAYNHYRHGVHDYVNRIELPWRPGTTWFLVVLNRGANPVAAYCQVYHCR